MDKRRTRLQENRESSAFGVVMRTLVSLFSGGGGLDLGLEAAGFETLLASDIDEHSCISLKANKARSKELGKPFLQNAEVLRKDVLELTSEEILNLTGLKVGELDLLAGGPPCQAFSIFGKRKGREDPRGRLVDHYLRLVGELRPRAFVFENVFGLLTIQNGQIFEEIKRQLANPRDGLNYRLSVHRCNAADYGVPQFRDRIFIIGSRDGYQIPEIAPICAAPAERMNLLPWRTAADGLVGVPEMGAAGWHNHTGRKHSDRIVQRYQSLEFGERDPKTRINRLDPNRPSFAIIVGSDAGGGKGHVHPHLPREVTPRESARMQCFPDWWWFSGTSRHPIRQVGNAVPSLLGYAVGRTILSAIFHDQPTSWAEAIRELGQEHLFTETELDSLEAISLAGRQDDLRLAI